MSRARNRRVAGVVPGSAAECREYVTSLLDRDTAYDGDPSGLPPLLVADYRRALYVLLAVDPDELPPVAEASAAVEGEWVTRFVDGRRSFAEQAVTEIARAWAQSVRTRAARRGRPGAAVGSEDVGGGGGG